MFEGVDEGVSLAVSSESSGLVGDEPPVASCLAKTSCQVSLWPEASAAWSMALERMRRAFARFFLQASSTAWSPTAPNESISISVVFREYRDSATPG